MPIPATPERLADESDTFIQLRSIRMEYPGVVALAGVDVDIPRGRVTALVGENGAGKSTLVSILAGLKPAYTGSIVIDGVITTLHSPAKAAEAGIALVQQELSLVPELSVAENILLGRPPHTAVPGAFSPRKLQSEVDRLLKEMGIDLPARRPVRQLSPAQAQLVEIMKGLARRPRLLILDEPTSSLTSVETALLMTVIRRLRDQGTSVLYISHKLDEVLHIADHVTVLRDGRKVESGPTSSWTEDRLIRTMVGRDLSQFFHRTAHAIGDVILDVSGISVPGRFENVSFAVRKGEIVGMAGLVGAGRTEVAEAIFGLVPPRSGVISIAGLPVRLNQPRSAIRQGIALVPEDRRQDGIVGELTTATNITVANLRRYSSWGWMSRRHERNDIGSIAERVNLKPETFRRAIRKLSGGNQQKAVISKWLLCNPRVLILDEPTRGIDVGAKSEIYELIHELTAAGLGVLLISSEMPEILGMSDRVLVMRKGALVAEFDREEATEEAIMAAASEGSQKREDQLK